MRNFAVVDIVLVVDEKFPRGSWTLGRVQDVYPNKSDGHVRRVKVKTMKSALERPVDKIVWLESAKPAADKQSWLLNFALRMACKYLETLSMNLSNLFIYYFVFSNLIANLVFT